MSRLGRLFKYAKSSVSQELENFSTEALASAIQEDPAPWLAALRRKGLLPEGSPAEDLVVQTQVGERSTKGSRLFLDLVVSFGAGGKRVTFWVEVKVNAGEHNNQLALYQARAAEMASAPVVITLARSSQVKVGVPGITWRDLAEASTASEHPHWRELCAFMEEKRMVLNSEDPILADDIEAAVRTIEMLDKMTERLYRFAKDPATTRTRIPFYRRRGSIRRSVGAQLGRYRRLCLPSRGRGPGLLVGVRWFGQGADKEARLMLCAEHNPKNVELRTQFLETANRNGLSKEWDREWNNWAGLLKSAPIDAVNGSVQGSVDWWLDALKELEAAGILAMISGGSKPDPTNEENETEDEEPDDEAE